MSNGSRHGTSLTERKHRDTFPALFARIQALCDASRALCAQSQAACAESQALCAESRERCAQSQALTWWIDRLPLPARSNRDMLPHTPRFACPVELMRRTDGAVEIHVTRRDGTVQVILGPAGPQWLTATITALQPADSDEVQLRLSHAE